MITPERSLATYLETLDTFSVLSLSDLEAFTDDDLDGLSFGVVGISPTGLVERYSSTEARMAGIPRVNVLGMPFFLGVAQCMNNFMVAQRFEDERELDVELAYVLTFRMRPTPVTLRLLKSPSAATRYLLIRR